METISFMVEQFKTRPLRTVYRSLWIPVYFIGVTILCLIVLLGTFDKEQVVDTWISNI